MILGNFCSLLIVNIWNSLPNAVVDVDSVDLFQSRLQTIFGCPKMLNIIILSTLPVPVSEYDIESY